MESEFRKSPESLAVLVVGTDTIIEALPARPIQLAHACSELGFDLVIPLSWGDELVAEAALRELESGSPKQAVFCSCPLVRQRLLASGADLAKVMVSLTPSPTAVARHLRDTMGTRLGSLTFAGRCPGATLPDYDVSYDPATLLGILKERGISLDSQPDTFVDRLPPDRRRHVSLPGGSPAQDALWQRCHEMSLVEVTGDDLSLEVAQALLSSQPVLIDLAAAVGCHCCGVTAATTDTSARIAVTSLEPPRSITPVVTDAIPELAVVIETDRHSADLAFSSEPGARPPMAVTPASALKARR